MKIFLLASLLISALGSGYVKGMDNKDLEELAKNYRSNYKDTHTPIGDEIYNVSSSATTKTSDFIKTKMPGCSDTYAMFIVAEESKLLASLKTIKDESAEKRNSLIGAQVRKFATKVYEKLNASSAGVQFNRINVQVSYSYNKDGNRENRAIGYAYCKCGFDDPTCDTHKKKLRCIDCAKIPSDTQETQTGKNQATIASDGDDKKHLEPIDALDGLGAAMAQLILDEKTISAGIQYYKDLDALIEDEDAGDDICDQKRSKRMQEAAIAKKEFYENNRQLQPFIVLMSDLRFFIRDIVEAAVDPRSIGHQEAHTIIKILEFMLSEGAQKRVTINEILADNELFVKMIVNLDENRRFVHSLIALAQDSKHVCHKQAKFVIEGFEYFGQKKIENILEDVITFMPVNTRIIALGQEPKDAVGKRAKKITNFCNQISKILNSSPEDRANNRCCRKKALAQAESLIDVNSSKKGCCTSKCCLRSSQAKAEQSKPLTRREHCVNWCKSMLCVGCMAGVYMLSEVIKNNESAGSDWLPWSL